MPALRTLPPRPDAAYHPVTYRGRTGLFEGVLDEVRWGYYRGWLHGQVRRALIRKRWFDVVVHTGQHVLFVHLQDDGTTGHGRVVVLDVQTGARLAWGRDDGAPLRLLVVGFMAAEGTEAFVHAPSLDVTLTRPEGSSAWRLTVLGGGVAADLRLDTAEAPRPTLLVGEGDAPYAHRPGLTQHHPRLTVSGRLTARGVTVPLEGASAHVTYSNAFLPPQIASHRVVADGHAPDGTPLALVLADGDLHGAWSEATLWWGERPWALPEVHVLSEGIGIDARWRVVSLDGTVDLVLVPGARTEAHASRQAGRVRHDHLHLAGTLSGTLPDPDGRAVVVTDLRAWGTWLRLRG